MCEADGWAIFVELYSDNLDDIAAMQKQLEANPLWNQLDAIDRNLGPALGAPPVVAASAAPRTVKHALGETAITGDAKRVVALEWTYVEDLLALGIQPIAIADVEGYKAWVKTPGVELSPDVVDVGFRGEPNLETILSLDPDLIIEIDYSAAAYYDKLSAIAPTLAFTPYPTDSAVSTYLEMQDTFLTIAGGQRQRAWIAMTLVQDTEFLLLDEPTTFLDLAHQVQVLDLLSLLNEEGKTIVMVLHDLNQAARYAHQLIALKGGKIYADGAPHTVLTETLVRQVFGVECRIVPHPVTNSPLVVPLGRLSARQLNSSNGHGQPEQASQEQAPKEQPHV